MENQQEGLVKKYPSTYYPVVCPNCKYEDPAKPTPEICPACGYEKEVRAIG